MQNLPYKSILSYKLQLEITIFQKMTK